MKEKFKKFFFKENVSDAKASETAENTADVLKITESTGNGDVLKDILSEEFEIFSEGRNDGLAERYEAFARLKASMLPKEPARGETGQERRLHSGFAEGGFKDVSCGLTKRQMEMARDAGMSFREYEELLNMAPAVKRNRF